MPRLPLLSGVAARILRPHVGLHRRAGDAARTVGLHQRAAIGLLVEGDLHHEHLHLDAEQRAGEGERRSPLAGAGLGADLLDPGLRVVEGLRHGGVGLVAAGRAHALVLVVDARRRVERLAPGAARDTAGSDATGGRPDAPARGSRSRARSLTSCMISDIGNSGARSSGPIGWSVPGCSTGGGGDGRSAMRLSIAPLEGARLAGRTVRRPRQTGNDARGAESELLQFLVLGPWFLVLGSWSVLGPWSSFVLSAWSPAQSFERRTAED